MSDVRLFTFLVNRLDIHGAAFQTGAAVCAGCSLFLDSSETDFIHKSPQRTQRAVFAEGSLVEKTDAGEETEKRDLPYT